MAMKKEKTEAEETIGRRLARMRRARGVTQVELAAKIGLVQSNVSDYERDVCRPNADMVLKIARLLDVSTDELLGHRTSAKAPPLASTRLLKRMARIQQLPRRDQQAVIRTIDAFLAKSS